MSLFSRNTEGGRRGLARMAAVFAGTLLTYLVVTAIPAFAVASSCARPGGAGAELVVTVGTDDSVSLALEEGAAVLGLTINTFGWSLNGGAFVDCTGTATNANIAWVDVLGQDDGAERFELFHADGDGLGADMVTANNVTVDLGNGSDTLTLEYGARIAPALPVVADGGGVNALVMGTSDDGTNDGLTVIDANADTAADVLVTDAETINVNTGGGADTVNAGGTVAIIATSVIAAPTTGDDIPGAGIGSPLTDNFTFNAGTGDDTLTSGDGADNFQGAAGADTVSYVGASAGVTADLTAATGTGQGNDTLSDVQNVTGSDFSDTITGNSLDNVLDGGLLNDTIDGGAGNDTLTGGAGNDTFLEGTADNGGDTITGGANTAAGDTVDLAGRTAALYIAPGGGAVSGEGGCPSGAGCEGDTYAADVENYLLGSGADTFVGSGSDEWVVPGAGDDDIDGGGLGADSDYLDLSDVAGPAVFDMITGTATGNGTDTFADVEGFVGTDADDSVLLDDVSGAPTDFIGGAGIDTVDASASAFGVVIDLSLYTSAPPDVEDVIGGSGGDVLTGNAIANNIWGNDGFDTIVAGAGNDFVEGGTGNDALTGGIGADTLSYVNSTTGMVIDTQLGFTDGIGGDGDGEDSLAGFEIVKGSDFGDEIIAGQTDADFNARLLGRGGDDIIVGTNSSDLLKGGGGDDYARGGGGDDDVYGAAGDDILLGSSGDDFLKGGKGFDEGNGGRGADICRSLEIEKSC